MLLRRAAAVVPRATTFLRHPTKASHCCCRSEPKDHRQQGSGNAQHFCLPPDGHLAGTLCNSKQTRNPQIIHRIHLTSHHRLVIWTNYALVRTFPLFARSQPAADAFARLRTGGTSRGSRRREVRGFLAQIAVRLHCSSIQMSPKRWQCPLSLHCSAEMRSMDF